jgi:hypothetical protein
MNFKPCIRHSESFRLQQFLNLNTKLVRYSINNFKSQNRAKSQKQSYYYAIKLWRDIKIVLQNKLAKVKSKLQSQLSYELCKPNTNHKHLIEFRDAIKLLLSIIEMEFGLPYKHDDDTKAINLIDKQLGKIHSQVTIARE